ncbi:MAG: ABC transporter substrate-binding protein [Hyphomonadaceae bacterium]|nr:ABC transporter substrate-binding protein [Hyphomonadaceae bacterium]
MRPRMGIAMQLTRAGFVAAFAAAALALTAPTASAARNQEAEAYVNIHANGALQALSNRNSADARQQAFSVLMNRFADVPRIATFVLGRYSTQLRADAALRRDWMAAFLDYSNAVYEDQLDRYRGNEIRVTGSTERTAGSDVIVHTEVTPRGASRPLPVRWRILKSGAEWKVLDVSLVLDGNEIWLAQQQQRDFLSQLDRNRGDIRALIASVRQTTAEMRQRIRARS